MTEIKKTVIDLTGANYLDAAFGDARKLIVEAKEKLRGVEYDTMIGTGLSGSLVVPILAHEFDVPNWAIVRKERTEHSGNMIEGRIGLRWIFVDDFISSGATRNRVLTTVAQVCGARDFETTFVGTYTYRDGGNWRVA